MRGNSFYNRQKFLLASLVLSDLIHLRKNYSSIDALPVWWPWSLELQIWKSKKRSLPCSSHYLNCTPSRPLFSAPKGFLEWSPSNMVDSNGVKKDLTEEDFPPTFRKWGYSTMSLSGQDLHLKCSWYRIWVFDHKCWRVLSAYMGFWALAARDSTNVQSLICHSEDLILISREYAIWKIMRSQECLSHVFKDRADLFE